MERHRAATIIALLTLVTLGWSRPAESAPPGKFEPVGRMTARRVWHTATLLANGKVLVTGGEDVVGGRLVIQESAELFDPATNRFSPAGAMTADRSTHTAIRLNDGRVLILGGFGDDARRNLKRIAEVYDPASGAFTQVGGMATPRVSATATLLRDGRVLVVGGTNEPFFSLENAVAEIFDPATGEFTTTGSAATARGRCAAVALADGRVAILGGGDPRVEIYDPATGQFAQQGRLLADRYRPAVVALPDGTLLVAGGDRREVELYDPATGQSVAVAATDNVHADGAAVLLADGQLLLAGGWGTNDRPHATSERVDPRAGTATPTAPLPGSRAISSALLLPDGRALITGGAAPGDTVLATAVVYVP